MDPGVCPWLLLLIVLKLVELLIGLEINFVLLVKLDFKGDDVGDVFQDRGVDKRLKLRAKGALNEAKDCFLGSLFLPLRQSFHR